MHHLKRARWMLGIVAAGLLVSGITVWPAVPELRFAVQMVWGNAQPTGTLHGFLWRAIEGLETVQAHYPFMLYAHDWLVFAHVALAILFLGAIRDPVRNVWIVECGLIMCALIPVLAVVCIPAPGVPRIIHQCGEAGILGVTVLSAGFRESGAEGRALEEQVRAEAARFDGLRVLGPNCLGAIVPDMRLNASFAAAAS